MLKQITMDSRISKNGNRQRVPDSKEQEHGPSFQEQGTVLKFLFLAIRSKVSGSWKTDPGCRFQELGSP